MPDVGHVGVELTDRQSIVRVWRISIAELQRYGLSGNPVPNHIVRQPCTVWPIRSDVFARRRQPRVEEVLLRPRIGPKHISQRRRGAAAVVAAGPFAVFQQFPVLVVSPRQPLVDTLRFDSRAEGGASDEPEAVPHTVETRRVARHVLARDGRFGLQHVVDGLDQPRHRRAAFCLGHVVVEPVPGHGGVNARRRIPVDRLLLLEALVVVVQAGGETLLGQIKVLAFFRDQEDECRRRGFWAKLLRLRLVDAFQPRQQSVGTVFDTLVPFTFGPQCSFADLGPRVCVEEQPWVIRANRVCPIRQFLAQRNGGIQHQRNQQDRMQT